MTALRFRPAVFLLILAGLACSAPGGAPADTPVPSQPAPNLTADSATSPVATPSVTPLLVVTATPPPLPAEQCPEPGSATLPAAPPIFAEYAATIQDFLTGGGSAADLRTALENWGGINANVGEVHSEYDYTGDSVPEIVVVVQAPPEQFPNGGDYPVDLYIYGCSDGAYTLLYADYTTPDRPAPREMHVISGNLDLNANGRLDLLYQITNCGAHTCFPAPILIEWDPASGIFRELSTSMQAAPYGEIRVTNTDGGEFYEIEIDGGSIGSAGAGPQRQYLDTYRWDGVQYTLAEHVVTTPESEWYPIHWLMDADDAFEQADYAGAIALYQHVIDDPNPRYLGMSGLSGVDEMRALRAYARYRIMVSHAAMSDERAAQAVYDQLSAEYAANPSAPGGGFFLLADVFWRNYSSTQDVSAACLSTVEAATANAESFSILNTFGYGNKYYEPSSLCRLSPPA